MYQPYLDFWMPRNKYQVCNWLIDRYPNVPKDKWLQMTSKRLKQIYVAIRTRKG